YFTYRRLAHSLRDIAIYRSASINVTDADGAGNAQRLDAGFVTANFMALFEVPAARGRALLESDDRPGAPHVVVISDGLWRTRFGADTNVIGKKFVVAGALREIVGVMPPSFRVPTAATQTWLPLQLDVSAAWLGGFNSRAFARLAPGASIASVE